MKNLICAVFVGLLLCACSLPASAADIPSSASGTYAGSGATAGWTCEVRAFQVGDGLGGSMRALSAGCDAPDGYRAGTITTADACVTEQLQPTVPRLWLPGQVQNAYLCADPVWGCTPPGTPKFSIRSYQPATSACALGEIRVQLTTLTAADPNGPGLPGPESVMCRTQITVPTTPYPGCGEPPRPADLVTSARRMRGWTCTRPGSPDCR